MTAGKPPADDERLSQLFDEAALPVAPELLGVLGCVKSLGDRPVPAPGADLLAFFAPADAPDRGRRKRLRGPIIGGTLAVSMGLGMSGVAAGPGTFADDLGSAVHSVLGGQGGTAAGPATIDPAQPPSPSDLQGIAGPQGGTASQDAADRSGYAGAAGQTGTEAAGVIGQTGAEAAGTAGVTGAAEPEVKSTRPSSGGAGGTGADREVTTPAAAPGRRSAPAAGHQGNSTPGPRPAKSGPAKSGPAKSVPAESESESRPAVSQPAESTPADLLPPGTKPAGGSPSKPKPAKSKPAKPRPGVPENGQGAGREAGVEPEAPGEAPEWVRKRPAPPASKEPEAEVDPGVDYQAVPQTPAGPESGNGPDMDTGAPDPDSPEPSEPEPSGREVPGSDTSSTETLVPNTSGPEPSTDGVSAPAVLGGPLPPAGDPAEPELPPDPALQPPSQSPSPPSPSPLSGEDLPLRGEDAGVEPGEVQSTVEAGVLDLQAAVHHHR